MNPYQKALLDSIIQNPDEDHLRLIYADWLEEHDGESECLSCVGSGGENRYPQDDPSNHRLEGPTWYRCDTCGGSGRVSNGFAARSEFVRVQIEIERHPHGRAEGYDCRDGISLEYERLFWCHEREKTFTVLRDEWFSDWLRVFDRIDVRRGFIDQVSCRLDDWLTHGKTICREHPVRRLTITDRQPLGSGDEWTWFNSEMYTPADRGNEDIPGAIFPRLETTGVGMPDNYIDYPTEEAARLALSRAAIAWARAED